MKNIIITGANGLVASELAHFLLENGEYDLHLISTHPSRTNEVYCNHKNIRTYTLESFIDNNKVEPKKYYALVHTAFARNSEGNSLADSLNYTQKVMCVARNMNIHAFINLSSQSVYGQISKPMWTETTPVAPNYMYALAKYSTELLTESFFADTSTNYTNIRLSSINENARFLNVFVKNAIEKKPITVMGGEQRLSFIDVRDVAEALWKVIAASDRIKLAPVYNVGTGRQHSLIEFARMTSSVCEELLGYPAEIKSVNADTVVDAGMDISLFTKTFDWTPRFTLKDMVTSLFALNVITKKSLKGGVMPVSFKIVYGY